MLVWRSSQIVISLIDFFLYFIRRHFIYIYIFTKQTFLPQRAHFTETCIMFLLAFINKKKIWICTITVALFFVSLQRRVGESVSASAPLPISKRKHHLWPVGWGVKKEGVFALSSSLRASDWGLNSQTGLFSSRLLLQCNTQESVFYGSAPIPTLLIILMIYIKLFVLLLQSAERHSWSFEWSCN